MTTNWYYDTHGFVNLILSNNGNLDGHGYTRDAVGNIVQETVNGATFTYGLDDLYRLSSATVMGTSYSWSYDLAGNRTQQIAGGVTTNYTYNAADRLATVNGTAVSHDANGQVTADETGGAYTWDVRGRLSGLTRNGVSASFLYDQDDLRISKTVGSTTTSYLLDGDEVVRETTGGTPTDLLQGPGTDNLLERGGNWLLHNGLDSTSAVVNGSGSILQYYYYAPFGQLTMQGGGSPQPYQLTGREADETGLMYYRARYYNPGWGRFVSQDPIGFSGGINPYAYCNNNPVDAGDPTGCDEVPGWVHGLANGTSAVFGILGGFGGFSLGASAGALTGPGVVVAGPVLSVSGATAGTVGGIVVGQNLVIGLYRLFSSGDGGSGGTTSPDPGEVLTPGGKAIGKPGSSPKIRELPGGEAGAEGLFRQLTGGGGTDVTPPGYKGTMIELPGGGRVGLRLISKSGSPAIDVRIPGINITKIHFLP